MRILIIRNAFQEDTGGAEKYAFNLSLALRKAGHTPVLVTKHLSIREMCRSNDIQSIQGVWHESQHWGRFGRHYYHRRIWVPIWYMWVIFRYRIDIVNPQSRDDFVFATIAARRLGKPVLWTDHADLKYILDRRDRPTSRMQKWILQAASYTKRIVCVSNSEEKLIESVAPELKNKLTVVHNGVFVPDNIKPIDQDGFIIGTNARLVPAKGIEELLRAFAKVSKKYAEAKLWIVGGLSGNELKYSKLISDLKIKDSVELIGYVREPNNYVARMDIFVHASYHEAFSLAIIEACMLGRPIIATNVGGTPEIINGETGILIRPRNVEDIESALNKLIKDPVLRNNLGDKARARAMKEFNFQTIVEKSLMPLYEELV